MIGSDDLRARFLRYFELNLHAVEKSSPLIPYHDPSLLFVNAGMVPFKNVFTGKEIRPYTRATSSQKCIRAGGKHNDLEHVGRTARHHTFFEMLGNFSFKDYFKEEAILFAWTFLTKEIGLDKSKLSVSIFAGDENLPPDIEAESIWHKKIGLSKNKIKRLPKADNFWQMGDSGPCGPCTEIHYDRSDIPISFGGHDPNDVNMEIWNLVFMQYDMQKDGKLKPLPAPCVDTGMGLERLASVANGLSSNYDTDLLYPLIEQAQILSHKKYTASDNADDIAMRVIADHARACAFLIADGLFPGNEGRSYVLRRFMRRAIRHGAHLGLNELFFHEVCLKVVAMMGHTYPELLEAKPLIEKVVMQEEDNFRRTLERGLVLFSNHIQGLKSGQSVPGDVVFKLYETFGFPADLTEDLAQEKGLLIDWINFEAAKHLHEQRSSQGLGLRAMDDIYLELAKKIPKTNFIDQPSIDNMKVLGLMKDGKEVDKLTSGQSGAIIFDQTCFYGESGGQVGDTGLLTRLNVAITVTDTKKFQGLYIHLVNVNDGEVNLSNHLSGKVDWARRQQIKRNHSATHLLHSALRKILGNHVTQKGSLVAPEYLRFDFSHFESLNKEKLLAVEDLVNEWILANEKAITKTMSVDEAKAQGALALFGEKYDEQVKVLDMGSHSRELCGGTHCHRTGDIGSFRIVSEGPIAQGIRRIEAITGDVVLKHSRANEQIIFDLEKILGVKSNELTKRVNNILEEIKAFSQEQKSQSVSHLKEMARQATENADSIGGINMISQIVDFDEPDLLRVYADFLRDFLKKGIVVLGQILPDNKCAILVATTKDISLHAGQIIKNALKAIDGKGGGRPDFAQAGGNNPQGLEQALKLIKEAIQHCSS